jgi:hypothetical protein
MQQRGRRRVEFGTALGVVALLVAGTACGSRGPKAPGREVVTPLLQQEADDLKREGEKLDPVLRVKATWTIAALDVAERPDDPDNPWAGTIRFEIRSETRDEQGAVAVDQFERRFHYLYSASLGRWIFQMKPPAPR